MITVTSKSRYAVSALAELASMHADKPVPIGAIAERRDIPVQFLEQLFSTLRRSGILKSQRGVKGGYSFAREPGTITVLEVVEALDGCICSGSKGSLLVFKQAAQSMSKVFASTSIADVVQAEESSGAQMYYI